MRFLRLRSARHGKRPSLGDLQRVYGIAVAHGFIQPEDVDGVAGLLHCTDRWARTLIQAAREAVTAARDSEIAWLKAEGMSNRQVANETGVPSRTVDRAVAPKRNSSDVAQPAPDPEQAARLKHTRELFSDATQDWHAVLEALRRINSLAPVDDLFAERWHGFDHAITPELRRAMAWLDKFKWRYEEYG